MNFFISLFSCGGIMSLIIYLNSNKRRKINIRNQKIYIPVKLILIFCLVCSFNKRGKICLRKN